MERARVHPDREASRRTSLLARAARVVGAGLLFASAGVHLDLYVTGYRTIPTIGGLFLAQVIVALLFGGLVVATPSRLASAGGGILALGTIGGYAVSLHQSLFGFREVQTTAGVAAGTLEVLAVGVLGAVTVWPVIAPARTATRRDPRTRLELGGVLGATTLAALALGVSLGTLGTPSRPSSGGSASLLVTTIGGVRVVTNASGYTLYWFAPDTSTSSACSGECAIYWPPVLGTPHPGPGVDGTLGTIRRSDGSTQATYDGHPLYTYIGDPGPRQNNGNRINLNGGEWYEMAAG